MTPMRAPEGLGSVAIAIIVSDLFACELANAFFHRRSSVRHTESK
jgi:hypothetical protein